MLEGSRREIAVVQTVLRPWLLLVAVAACGCGATESPSDLTAPDLSVPDLSIPDLGTPSDLSWPDGFRPNDAAGFCDGTSLAGTCAQSFFRSLAECFPPITGACVTGSTASWNYYFCWQSGPVFGSRNAGCDAVNRVWARDPKTLCMEMIPRCNSSGSETAEEWQANPGDAVPTTLLLDPANGDVTCPDGTHANIGPNHSDCAALHQLLDNVATYTQCPWNYKSDLGIWCPPSGIP